MSNLADEHEDERGLTPEDRAPSPGEDEILREEELRREQAGKGYGARPDETGGEAGEETGEETGADPGEAGAV